MRRIITLLLTAVVGITAVIAHEVSIDGNKIGGKSVKQILFDREDVTIVFDDKSTMQCDGDLLIDMTTTGVNNLRYYDAASLRINGDEIIVSGLDPLRPITIVSAAGQVVKTIAAPKTDTAAIGIAHLAPGVYLLRSGATTIRFVKR